MTEVNIVVRDLLNALDEIARAARKQEPYAPYIQGIAEQAIWNAHARMVRDADGYFVVGRQNDPRM